MEATVRQLQEDINSHIEQLVKTYQTFAAEDLPFMMVQWGHMAQLLLDVGSRALKNPNKLIHLMQCYQKKTISLIQHHIDYLNSEEGRGEFAEFVHLKMTDQRFNGDSWEQSYWYKMIKDFYLLYHDFALSFLDCTHEMGNKIHDQMALYVRNYIDALSPSNFLITNPEALKVSAEKGWVNLLQGMKHFIEDLIDNNGHFNVRMTDKLAFTVGKNIANTPGDIIFRNDIVELIQYAPQTPTVYQTPILIVPPFINKYYILDINQEKSLVNWLVQQGYTVFLLSWVNPGPELKHKKYEDYVVEGIGEPLQKILETYHLSEVNMLGYCVGGTLLACFLSYLKKTQQSSAKSVTYLATLVDFEDPGEIGVFIDEQQLNTLNSLMDKKGYFDGRLLMTTFNLLRPNDLVWPYFINNYLKGSLPAPFDLLYWNCDSTHQPAAMYQYYLHEFYLKNAFKKNQLTIRGVPISLNDIEIPIFYLSCQNDHITPWTSVYRGALLQPGPKTFVLSDAGHVAGVVNPPSRNKYGFWTYETLLPSPHAWYKHSTKHNGSWWSYWEKWLSARSGQKVPTEQVKVSLSLCKAPGEYVRKTI